MNVNYPGESQVPGVLGDSRLQSQTLESVASAVHYHAWVTDLARPYLGDCPVELGSGLGDYAVRWLYAGVPTITVTEADRGRLAVLTTRFAAEPRVETLGLDVSDPPAREHSALVACNVLEHIPDHVGALASAHRLLRPGGAVVMFVPAFPFAMGDFDRAVGHVRRYTRASLGQAYRDAGLTVERLYYVNAPGLPAWFVGVRLLRMTPGDGVLLRLWDRFVVPVARFAESRWVPPFGQSLFAVGRVPS
jgi:SAM-dependent methyltransferase